MTNPSFLGLVTASVFGAFAVVPYVVAALRRRPEAPRSRRTPM